MHEIKIKPIHKRMTIILLSSIFSITILLDLIGFGGNIRYYAKWVTCFEKPVATRPYFFGDGTDSYYYRDKPFSSSYYSLDSPYFCNPTDAELHGYSFDHSTFTLNKITWDDLRESYKQNHDKPGYELLTTMKHLSLTAEDVKTSWPK